MLEILADRTYRHLLLAQVVALLGTGLATVALGLLAYNLAGDGAAMVLGTVFTIKMVAYVGIAPIAGAFADRVNRRALVSFLLFWELAGQRSIVVAIVPIAVVSIVVVPVIVAVPVVVVIILVVVVAIAVVIGLIIAVLIVAAGTGSVLIIIVIFVDVIHFVDVVGIIGVGIQLFPDVAVHLGDFADALFVFGLGFDFGALADNGAIKIGELNLQREEVPAVGIDFGAQRAAGYLEMRVALRKELLNFGIHEVLSESWARENCQRKQGGGDFQFRHLRSLQVGCWFGCRTGPLQVLSALARQ